MRVHEVMVKMELKSASGRGKPVDLLLPKKLDFSGLDYLKALYSWLRAFRNTNRMEPGLYYTGEKYDINSPLLVSCNYHLTVFLLWRILRRRTVRLLVIDTHGINVWCSSGKGQFSAETILAQIRRYGRGMLSASATIELMLPKLSLSGVRLAALREHSIRPIIGPIYMSDIPAFLDSAPLRDRAGDSFRFTLKDRLFTLPPSLVQFMKYYAVIFAILLLWNVFFSTGIHWQAAAIGLIFGVLYILLFPLLPTKRFAVKGLVLAAMILAFFAGWVFIRRVSLDSASLVFYTSFTIATALFFSLYYTGNSGVSNYSLVKREIVLFLPPAFFLFLISFAAIIVKGVLS